MQDPIHTTSYLLDPRFRNDAVTEMFRRNGIAAIKKVLHDSES